MFLPYRLVTTFLNVLLLKYSAIVYNTDKTHDISYIKKKINMDQSYVTRITCIYVLTQRINRGPL